MSQAMGIRDTMARLARGQLLDRVFDALYAVSLDVINTGQKGTVTMTLTVTQPVAGEPHVVVNEQVKRTYPTELSRGADLFVGEGGFYQRDPRQEEIPELRSIEGGAEIREAPDGEHVERRA